MFKACLLAQRVGQPGLMVCTGHLRVLGVGEDVQGEKVPGLEESELAESGVRPEQSGCQPSSQRVGTSGRVHVPLSACLSLLPPAFWLHPQQSRV